KAKTRRGLWPFSREAEPYVNTRVRALLLELAAPGAPALKLIDELTDVRESDAREWAERPDVVRLARRRDLPSEVSAIFARRRTDALTMQALAAELADLLEHSAVKEEP
ncbi:MAG TPA: hypothetical protein VK509_01215, partial [Polyangiales bacterium]|nr:hypothetical protein [Polyangiales bacterium]